MVNIGRPSQGCMRCRRRKVKCDQQKPGCLRCEKIGRDCPGYLHPDTWLFVDEKGLSRRNDRAPPTKGVDPSRALPSDVNLRSLCLFFETFYGFFINFHTSDGYRNARMATRV